MQMPSELVIAASLLLLQDSGRGMEDPMVYPWNPWRPNFIVELGPEDDEDGSTNDPSLDDSMESIEDSSDSDPESEVGQPVTTARQRRRSHDLHDSDRRNNNVDVRRFGVWQEYRRNRWCRWWFVFLPNKQVNRWNRWRQHHRLIDQILQMESGIEDQ